jgi:hypothetical protein
MGLAGIIVDAVTALYTMNIAAIVQIYLPFQHVQELFFPFMMEKQLVIPGEFLTSTRKGSICFWRIPWAREW